MGEPVEPHAGERGHGGTIHGHPRRMIVGLQPEVQRRVRPLRDAAPTGGEQHPGAAEADRDVISLRPELGRQADSESRGHRPRSYSRPTAASAARSCASRPAVPSSSRAASAAARPRPTAGPSAIPAASRSAPEMVDPDVTQIVEPGARLLLGAERTRQGHRGRRVSRGRRGQLRRPCGRREPDRQPRSRGDGVEHLVAVRAAELHRVEPRGAGRRRAIGRQAAARTRRSRRPSAGAGRAHGRWSPRRPRTRGAAPPRCPSAPASVSASTARSSASTSRSSEPMRAADTVAGAPAAAACRPAPRSRARSRTPGAPRSGRGAAAASGRRGTIRRAGPAGGARRDPRARPGTARIAPSSAVQSAIAIGVDREVPSLQVLLQRRAGSHLRQRTRARVALRPRRGDVEHQIAGADHGGPEPVVRHGRPARSGRRWWPPPPGRRPRRRGRGRAAARPSRRSRGTPPTTWTPGRSPTASSSRRRSGMARSAPASSSREGTAMPAP